MTSITEQLKKIKDSQPIGLMTHVVVGYPSMAETKELILALANGGSDFIELQIPFSDPIADGPTIMQASDTALKNGITTDIAMELMKEVSAEVAIPLLFMCYYNTVHHLGVEKFCKRAAQAGAAGLIVPDIPPEEEAYEHMIATTRKYALPLIRVISPASSEERLRKNAEVAEGFVYCVSRYGVTGTHSQLAPDLQEYLERARGIFRKPLSVGFGISSPEQVQALKPHAEIAVVGSAIVEKVRSYPAGKIDYKAIEQYIRDLKV